MKTITIQEVEYIAFKLAREKFSFDEPIPDFSTRFPKARAPSRKKPSAPRKNSLKLTS